MGRASLEKSSQAFYLTLLWFELRVYVLVGAKDRFWSPISPHSRHSTWGSPRSKHAQIAFLLFLRVDIV
jgi:hypothetical protein